MAHSVFSVAKWFMQKDSSMSTKKLQKICWYAYSWYIVLNYNPEEGKDRFELLFNDSRPEAWVHGPVFKELFESIKYHNSSEIEEAINIENSEIISFFNSIWTVYGCYSGDELESISHQEKPWLEARKGYGPFDICKNIIEISNIFDEYLPRLKV